MRNFKLKIVALLFAIGFWFFVLSQQKFLLTMEVPLVVSRVPEVLAIVSTPPKMISIQVSGYVLDLLRVRADKDGISVVVNAQDVEQGWSHFTISQENFYAPEHPNVQYVEGDRIRSLDVEFDTKVVRKIPVRLQADFECASGYTFVETPKISPQEIEVSGARATLMALEYLYTKTSNHKDLMKNSKFDLEIQSDSLPAYVQLKDSIVQVELFVQEIATKTFEKVPVHLIGVYDKTKYSLEPAFAEVEIVGGKEVLKEIRFEELDLFIEFSRFAIENTESLPASVRFSKNIKGLQIRPENFSLLERKDSLAVQGESVSEAP
jgi:YbbR domain-containing protein